MFRRLLCYYLPFDEAMTLSFPMIWENGKRYAYRHGIACVGLGITTVAADYAQLPVVTTVAFGLTCTTSLVGSVLYGAAIDPQS